MTDTAGELVEVRILGMSLDAYRTSSAHHDELFREFALMLARPPSAGHAIPSQLLALIERLTNRFSAFTASPEAEIQAALERGDKTIDLTYHVPVTAREDIAELADLLARSDEYCQQGELLTILPPREAVRFREWFLLEFIDQINGAQPVPWSEFKAQGTRA